MGAGQRHCTVTINKSIRVGRGKEFTHYTMPWYASGAIRRPDQRMEINMTTIRPKLSKKNPYWISVKEFRTVYYFALQYREWKQEYDILANKGPGIAGYGDQEHISDGCSSTERNAMKLAALSAKIDMIESTLKDAASDIYEYLLIGVTEEGASYKYLRMKYDIPCGKDYYYAARRRFYWKLSKKLNDVIK